MNEDSRKRSGIKHYQNPDYPSGSFEAAIQADREAELRSSAHLRLERHPSMETDDIETMVPEFMHRDFFRSEEDAIDAVNAGSRLRIPKKSRKGPLMVPRVPVPVLPDPVAGYVAPPMTEDASFEADSTAVATPSKSDAPPQVELPLRPLRAAEPPLPPSPRNTPLRSVPSSDSAGAPAQSPVLSPERLDTARLPPEASPSIPRLSAKASSYSVPLVAALLLVMGLFLWREQTRPEIVPQEALAVPATVPVALDAPSPSAPPTFLVVGPPVPSGADLVSREQVLSDETSPAVVEGLNESDQASGEAADDLAQRAAILEKMNEGSGTESSALPAAESSEELPWESQLPSDPVRKAPKPAKAPAAVRPNTASATAKASVQPAAVKKPPVATAADLFPIDEELPLNNPAVKAPPSAPRVAPAAAAPAPAAPAGDADGYEIAEPNL